MTELLCIKCDGEEGEMQPLFGNLATQPVAWVHAACLEDHQAENTPERAAERAAANAEEVAAFRRVMESSKRRGPILTTLRAQMAEAAKK